MSLNSALWHQADDIPEVWIFSCARYCPMCLLGDAKCSCSSLGSVRRLKKIVWKPKSKKLFPTILRINHLRSSKKVKTACFFVFC